MEIEVRAFVVKGEDEWDEDKTRYAIYEKGTERKLDDAQGFGYKSPQKAYAAWHYKHRTPEQKKKQAEKERKIRKWLKEHQDFADLMEDEAFYALKDGEDFNGDYVRQMLKDANLKIDFTVGDLLRIWRKT